LFVTSSHTSFSFPSGSGCAAPLAVHKTPVKENDICNHPELMFTRNMHNEKKIEKYKLTRFSCLTLPTILTNTCVRNLCQHYTHRHTCTQEEETLTF